MRLHPSFGHSAGAATPAYALASGFGGQSPFTVPGLSTSSQLARRRRRDGPSLAFSHNPSTGPHRLLTRPSDFVPNTTATATTTTNPSAATITSSQNSSQQHNRLPLFRQPSASTAPQTLLHPPLFTPLLDSPDDDSRPDPLREPNSDDFLAALATGDFSSPSLPPHSPQSSPQHRSQLGQLLDHSAHRLQSGFQSQFPPAQRLPDPETGLYKVEDQGDGDYDLDDERPVDSLHSEMPATRKRSRAAATVAGSPDEREVGPSAPKRPRTAAARRAATPGRSRNTPRPTASRNYTPVPAVTIESDDNDHDSIFDGDGDSGGVELYDLTTSDDGVPKELFQPVKDSSIRLSSFECVICMDAATNLTVTCCGMSILACQACAACWCFAFSNHASQVTCSALNVSTKPCIPNLPRRSARCAASAWTNRLQNPSRQQRPFFTSS